MRWVTPLNFQRPIGLLALQHTAQFLREPDAALAERKAAPELIQWLRPTMLTPSQANR